MRVGEIDFAVEQLLHGLVVTKLEAVIKSDCVDWETTKGDLDNVRIHVGVEFVFSI